MDLLVVPGLTMLAIGVAIGARVNRWGVVLLLLGLSLVGLFAIFPGDEANASSTGGAALFIWVLAACVATALVTGSALGVLARRFAS